MVWDQNIATLLSRNLQVSLAATKNLFVKTVTYAVSFTDQSKDHL